MDGNLAPIALFVYNRPDHLKQTLDYLSKNNLANQSKLFVFCDGPKKSVSENDLANITKVRAIVEEQKWAKEIEIIKQDKNVGLAKSITSGLNYVFKQYNKVIVVEDDIVTSKDFLTYMNKALNFYEGEDKVMHISGFIPPIKANNINQDYFFIRNASCWGWATWKRAWQQFPINEEEIKQKLPSINKNKFNYSNNYFRMLNRALNKEIDSWAIKWYFAVYTNGGLCLHPKNSMAKNIGLDNTGVHSPESIMLSKTKVSDANHYQFPNSLEINKTAENKVKCFFFMNRVRQTIYNYLKI